MASWRPHAVFADARGLFSHQSGESKPRQRIADITRKDVPALSPDGRQVLYRKEANLYVFDLATRNTVPLTTDGGATTLNGQLDWVYPEELDSVWPSGGRPILRRSRTCNLT